MKQRSHRPAAAALAALLATVALGCERSRGSASGDVLRTARAYERLRIEGDRWSLTELLSDRDVAVFGEGLRERFAGLDLPRDGIEGGRLDSVRAISIGDDTARVVAHVSSPTWSDAWEAAVPDAPPPGLARVCGEEACRRAKAMHEERRRVIRSLRDSLPLDREADTLTLVRQDGRWRVWLDLVHRERLFRAHRMMALGDYTAATPLGARIRHARGYLELARRYPSYATAESIEHARTFVRLAPYLDSVRVREARLFGSGRSTRVRVALENRSGRSFRRINLDLAPGDGSFPRQVALTDVRAGSVADTVVRISPGVDSIARAVINWMALEDEERPR